MTLGNETRLAKTQVQQIRLQRKIARMQAAWGAEQKTWERLLHDEFGQSLAAIKSFAVGIKQDADINSDTYELADIIQSTADDLYTVSYDLMRGFRAGLLADTGLLDGIQLCLENSRLEQRGIRVQVQAEGAFESLGDFLNASLLRIVQESLSGIVRSSNPDEILISIILTKAMFTESGDNTNDIIELKLAANALDTDAFDKYMTIFQRTQAYVQALGGEYSINRVANSAIEIEMNLNATDFIEDDAE